MTLRFRTKLFLLLVVLAFLATASLSAFCFYVATQIPQNWTLSVLTTTTVLMAEEVDPVDVVLLHDENNPDYEAARARLLDQCRRVVRAIDLGKTRFRLIDERASINIHTDEPGVNRTAVSTDPDLVGNTFAISRFPVYSRGWHEPVVRTEPLKSEYGKTYAAFAPIRNAQGEAVGVFAITAQAKPLNDFRWYLLAFFVGIMGPAILGAAVAAWFASRWISRPITALDHAMQRVAEDDLSARMPDTRSHDEFQRVADRFNGMVDALRERAEMKASLVAASDIQRRLLPTSPRLRGYDLDGLAVYCDESGGDYFDFIPLDADEDAARYWAVALGDVAGHGIGPALLMAWTRAAFRVIGPDRQDDLQGLFQFINRQLVRDTPAARFVTLFYAVLDTQTGTLHWTSAGHEPAVLIRDQGAVERLEATDIPLGVQADAVFSLGQPVRLARGDQLIITSDGITQQVDAQGRFFDTGGVAEAVRNHPNATSRELCRHLIQAARDYAGDRLIDDDLTAVALRVTG